MEVILLNVVSIALYKTPKVKMPRFSNSQPLRFLLTKVFLRQQ